MLRPLLRASAACAFAALLAPAVPAAAPPPGIAYDEIVRIVVNQTPPPPGNFQADLAAIASATPAPVAATQPPRKRGLGNLGSLAGAVLSGNPNAVAGAVAEEAVSGAVEAAVERSLSAQYAGLAAIMNSFLQPHVVHYAYWNGWERVDDTALQTATIRKCDIGQVIRLDLARKTYSIYAPGSEPEPTSRPVPRTRGRQQPANPEEPGTANASFALTTRSLGPKAIENRPTTGYSTTATFAMTNATGSCRNGTGSIETVEYLPAIARPSVTQCPIRRSAVPEEPTEIVAPPSGGCRPTFSAQKSGPALPSNRLSLYTLVRMSGGGGASPAPQASGANAFAFLTERGNLKGLGPGDASLFAIPQGFTKTP